MSEAFFSFFFREAEQLADHIGHRGRGVDPVSHPDPSDVLSVSLLLQDANRSRQHGGRKNTDSGNFLRHQLNTVC